MKTVLVTGGCGFIGSNFIPFFMKKHHEVRVVNLDLMTYAADESNLDELKGNPNYIFVKGDIRDQVLVAQIFSKYDICGVFHFAAESHVDNSISGPKIFVETNVLGTFQLLEAARQHWMLAPQKFKPGYETTRFLHVSTDEVYGTLGESGFFTEETPYAPNSPYSASKAGSDHLVRAYHHTYGMNVVTTNCSNNYGPKQHGEKLIPTIIKKALLGQSIPIYGKGMNIRDWLFVEDHCSAIDAVFSNGRSGETYIVGTRNERRNIEIAQTICQILDKLKPAAQKYESLITYVQDRPGHDFRYAIDPSKLEAELSWKSTETFESGLRKTVQWYLNR